MLTDPPRSVVTRYDSETLPMVPRAVSIILKGKLRNDVITGFDDG